MVDDPPSARTPALRAWLTVAWFALPPAVVLAVVAFLVVDPIAAVVVLVVVAGALGTWALRRGPARIRAALGGTPADPVRHARLINLVEGLASSTGIRVPELIVVPDPALNALVAGMTPETAFLAVTEGLLDGLSRIELEGVLAEELVQIRRGETVPVTVLAATFGWGARWAVPVDRDARADQMAVSLTRYPPGLEAALQKVEQGGSAIGHLAPGTAHLWLADPTPGGAPSGPVTEGPRTAARPIGRLPIPERVAALREL